MEKRARALSEVLDELGPKLFSGRIDVDVGAYKGAVHLAEGQLVDARIGAFTGETALWRMLLPHAPLIGVEAGRAKATGGAVLGMAAPLLARWREREALLARYADKIGGFEAVWAIRYDVLASRLDELPDAINPLLRLLDGRRAVRQVVAESSLEELLALRILGRLLASGVLEVPSGSVVPTAAEALAHESDGGLEAALLSSIDAEPEPIPLDTVKRPTQPPAPVSEPPPAAPAITAEPAHMPSPLAAPPSAPPLSASDDLKAWLGNEEAFFQAKPAPATPAPVVVGPALLVVLVCAALALGAIVATYLG
jgi:hypothetical protein